MGKRSVERTHPRVSCVFQRILNIEYEFQQAKADLKAEIVEKALGIAADICIYTNHNLTLEELDAEA